MKAALIVVSLMGYALAAPASADSNAPPASTSREICSQAAAKLFFACMKTIKHDEPRESLRERCYKERDDARESCLGVDVQQEVEKVKNNKQTECTVSGNRAFAQCMKDRVLKKSGETKEDCEKKRKNVSEACIKGKQTAPGNEETTCP